MEHAERASTERAHIGQYRCRARERADRGPRVKSSAPDGQSHQGQDFISHIRPSQTASQLEEHLMNDGNGAARRKVLSAGAIGNFVEYYDVGLYGLFATTIASVFFPKG